MLVQTIERFYETRVEREFIWLSLGTLLSVLPHLPRMPVWIGIVFFLFLFLRLLKTPDAPSLPYMGSMGRISKAVLAAFMFTAVFISYGTLLGRDAGIALLVSLSGLKLYEVKCKRDYYITSFMGLFLVMTNFFYSQTILTAMYMVLCVVFILFALLDVHDEKKHLRFEEKLKRCGGLFIQAIPMTLVLFILFPRIPGPLWSLPEDAHSGLTGLDDDMSPGTISRLTLSNEIAFRVEFAGSLPDQSQLYWRGPVLWHSDGVRWTRGAGHNELPPVAVSGAPIKQTITLEPTGRRWLFALEIPKLAPHPGYFRHDREIRTRRRITNRMRYEVQSYLHFHLGRAFSGELHRALQLPRGYHPRAVELARSWSAQALSDQQIVNKALQLFHQQAFYYTLQPPLLPDDSVDQFLFETRRGFCEHYASAFVVLMRAASVPARVVTGYQGGVMNPIGNYLVVRQRDAHAWAEVWLENKGWGRVDPTSAVAPTRIRDGIEGAFPETLTDIPLGLNDYTLVRSAWFRFKNSWDAINNRWNQWVLGYDQKRQNLVLGFFGLNKYNRRALLPGLGLFLSAVMLVTALFLFRRTAPSRDRARLLYEKFCKKLGRAQIIRGASEGPEDFANRAAASRSDLAERIKRISSLYIAVRYNDDISLLEELDRQVKRFKVMSRGHPDR